MKFVVIKVEKGVPELVDTMERMDEADALLSFKEFIEEYYTDGLVYLSKDGMTAGVRNQFTGKLKFKVWLRWTG